MKAKQLKPEVAEKYKLVGISPGSYHFNGFGHINLCAMDIGLADLLAASGFPYLVIKPVRKKRS